MIKTSLNLSTKILLLMFALLFGFSLYALWQISTGALSIQFGWPWVLGFIVSAVGLLVLARETK